MSERMTYEVDCMVTFSCGHDGLMRRGTPYRGCDLCLVGMPRHVRPVGADCPCPGPLKGTCPDCPYAAPQSGASEGSDSC